MSELVALAECVPLPVLYYNVVSQKITGVNDLAGECLGVSKDDLLDQGWQCLFGESEASRLEGWIAKQTGSNSLYPSRPHLNGIGPCQIHVRETEIPGMYGCCLVVEQAAESRSRRQWRQQSALAELGREALATSGLANLFANAVEMVVRCTDAETVFITEPADDPRSFLVCAATGAESVAVGNLITEPTIVEHFQAVIRHPGPVVVENYRSVLPEQPAATKSVTVSIGDGVRCFGLLIVLDGADCDLSPSDREFLVGVASTLAAAIARRRSEQIKTRLVSILEATPDFVGITDTLGHPIYVNRAGRKMLGLEEPQSLDESPNSANVLQWAEKMVGCSASFQEDKEVVWRGETVFEVEGGAEIPISQVVIAHRSSNGKVECLSTIARDISQEKNLERQLRQAQKMEAVGRLAGGVAHDFNNLLTGIRGFTDLLLTEETDDAKRKDLCEIRELTDRATDLTRQLLAFSRQQPIAPTVVNINRLVHNTSRMLQRLIGEHIVLEHHIDPELGNVCVDPGQVEQILLNLAVNSRDAMPEGGKLLIETRNVYFDEQYADQYIDLEPGNYVMLAVTDTGCGMDEQTKLQIFEPFFTTKKLGHGTGLGLATVYGIVKQHGGHIWVYSEVGSGTTFKIFLPRVRKDVVEPARTQEQSTHGCEAILVIEDEDAVRNVIERILGQHGYTVHCASGHTEARALLSQHQGEIKLLLADVVMPGCSGPDFYRSISDENPGLKVIYMSGHTDESVVRHGVLEQGVPFVQKPFESHALVRRIRQVLDQ